MKIIMGKVGSGKTTKVFQLASELRKDYAIKIISCEYDHEYCKSKLETYTNPGSIRVFTPGGDIEDAIVTMLTNSSTNNREVIFIDGYNPSREYLSALDTLSKGRNVYVTVQASDYGRGGVQVIDYPVKTI